MKMNKKRSAVTISMPKDMAEEYDKLAKRLAKNRSALFREMFIAYKKNIWVENFENFKNTA
ncbi:MAG: ribbon-helix-helix domain-containing protein [Desulfobacterales bacterium]